MFKKFNNDKWSNVALCVQLIVLLVMVVNAIRLHNISQQLDATLESVKTRSAVIDGTSTQTEPTDGASTQTETNQTSSDEVVLYDIRKPHDANILWCSDENAGACGTPNVIDNMGSIIEMTYQKMFRLYGDKSEIPDDIEFELRADTTLDDYTYKTYVRTNYNGARITRIVEDKSNRKIHIYYANMNESLYRADVQLQKAKYRIGR